VSDLVAQGLAIQRAGRPRYQQKAFVDVMLNIAGNEWSGEAEVIYTDIPASPDRPDEPGYARHIEIDSCCLLYTRRGINWEKQERIDVTGLVHADEDLHEAIQLEIIGE